MQAQALCSQVFVVVGFGGNQVRQSFKDDSINWVEQAEQLGTGHAVQQAMPYIDDDSISLVLYGDVPLIEQSTLEKLTTQVQKNGVALLSVILENPTGYAQQTLASIMLALALAHAQVKFYPTRSAKPLVWWNSYASLCQLQE
jgi:bifunctional UDP-N-acetylglucosamine pyrophosphorylase/glucosamine-1-phosphate N-acetyltransferase